MTRTTTRARRCGTSSPEIGSSLEAGSETRARHGELGQRWNDIQERLVHRTRAAGPTPSRLAEREALLTKANELAGRWEGMRGDDRSLGVALDDVRTSVRPLASMVSDPASRPEDIKACGMRSLNDFAKFADAAKKVTAAMRSNDAFAEGSTTFETTATEHLSGRQGGSRSARRRQIVIAVAPVAVPTLLILVLGVVIAVNV